MSSFKYPATVESNDEGGFIASFRDVPEAITEASDMEELQESALDALITAIDFYVEDHRKFPLPSKAKKGDMLVPLPASVVSKVLLLNAMVENNIRPADLAREMNIRPQEVTRITDVKHATKIDTIQAALRSIGKELELAIR